MLLKPHPLFSYGFPRATLTFYILQGGWALAVLLKTEKFYDFLGSLSFLALAIGSLTFGAYYSARQIVVTVLVSIWVLRLGSLLVYRVIKVPPPSPKSCVESIVECPAAIRTGVLLLGRLIVVAAAREVDFILNAVIVNYDGGVACLSQQFRDCAWDSCPRCPSPATFSVQLLKH